MFTAEPFNVAFTVVALFSVVIAAIALFAPTLRGPRGWRGVVFRALHATCWLLFGLAVLARADTLVPAAQMPAFLGAGLAVFLLIMLMIHRAATIARG